MALRVALFVEGSESLLEDPEARALILAHPICQRLRECLARS